PAVAVARQRQLVSAKLFKVLRVFNGVPAFSAGFAKFLKRLACFGFLQCMSISDREMNHLPGVLYPSRRTLNSNLLIQAVRQLLCNVYIGNNAREQTLLKRDPESTSDLPIAAHSENSSCN